MSPVQNQSSPWSPPAVAGALLACGDRPDRDETGTAGSASVGDTTAVETDTVGTASGAADLTDANIVALLDHANAADSSAGALAAKKATNADVKQFAKMMMADHHQLRQQGGSRQETEITPEPPANDPVTALEQQETQALQAAAEGRRTSTAPTSSRKSPRTRRCWIWPSRATTRPTTQSSRP